MVSGVQDPSKSEQPVDLLPPGSVLSAPNPNPNSFDSKRSVVPLPDAMNSGKGLSSSDGKKSKRRRRRRIKLPIVGELSWKQMVSDAVEWISNPVNMALFFWCLLAIGAFVVHVAVRLGLANSLLKDPQVRAEWEEVSLQIVNALFVLMCLVWHPVFMRDVLLLVRWKPKDRKEIRMEYCKGGTRKPHDRLHMSIVVFWLQVTCWATYAFAAVFWLYKEGNRPTWFILVTTIISFAAPAFAFLHLVLSPLGRDYDVVKEEEVAAGGPKNVFLMERSVTFMAKNRRVEAAQWAGTVCPGCCNNKRVGWLTCLFPFCMFGYNMERMGYGHRVTHAAMFTIIMLGPILIFEVSASTIEQYFTRDLVYYCGVLIALLGLGYGGAWRMRMRTQFKLPASRICCWSPGLTDVCTWMFCPCCALCQEIRTVDSYEVVEDAFYLPARGGDGDLEAGGTVPETLQDTIEEDEEEEGEEYMPQGYEYVEEEASSDANSEDEGRNGGQHATVATKAPAAMEMGGR